MIEGRDAVSVNTYARLGGILYLIIIAIGVFGEAYIRGTLVMPGDPAATAANITAQEGLWRFGVAAELVLLSCGVALALIFYVLLRPVHRELALMAIFFNLVTIAVEAVAGLFLLATLFPLGGAAYLGGLDQAQLAALATFSVRSHSYGFGFALIFFGWFALIAGYLIFRSGYLPRALGVLMQLAGAAYVINSFSLILAPAFAARLFPAIMLPPFVAELSLALWLAVKGVNAAKWQHTQPLVHSSRSRRYPDEAR